MSCRGITGGASSSSRTDRLLLASGNHLIRGSNAKSKHIGLVLLAQLPKLKCCLQRIASLTVVSDLLTMQSAANNNISFGNFANSTKPTYFLFTLLPLIKYKVAMLSNCYKSIAGMAASVWQDRPSGCLAGMAYTAVSMSHTALGLT